MGMQNIPNSLMKSHEERVERFMARTIPEPNTGCWIWLSEIRKSGYGGCWVFGKKEKAHQAAYREFVCEIPDGAIIRHTCDTPLCVNPDHLKAGTQAENMADKVARNRQTKGAGIWNSKLTDDQVRQIRARTGSQYAIAAEFGVSQSLVSLIKRRKSWSHVE